MEKYVEESTSSDNPGMCAAWTLGVMSAPSPPATMDEAGAARARKEGDKGDARGAGAPVAEDPDPGGRKAAFARSNPPRGAGDPGGIRTGVRGPAAPAVLFVGPQHQAHRAPRPQVQL